MEYWKRIESVFLWALLALKTFNLARHWGQIRGYDAFPYLEMLRHVSWFSALPSPREYWLAFHPPLSFLLNRILLPLVPGDVESSQILSALCVVGAFLLLRATLRRLGLLWSLPGIAFLYLTFSTPLIVFLGRATSIDVVLFFWFFSVFFASVWLLWSAPTTARASLREQLTAATLVTASLAAALLTKFTGALFMTLPFFVLAVRYGRRMPLRLLPYALIPCALSALLVSPLYIRQYVRTEGTVFPFSMTWFYAEDLQRTRALRDARPMMFLAHMLRIPTDEWTNPAPQRDSLIQSLWMQMWKRDPRLGDLNRIPTRVSHVYVLLFAVSTLGGTLMGMMARNLPQSWKTLGVILGGVTVLLISALSWFGYQYPLWDLIVFKATYIAPIVLWPAFATATLLTAVERIRLPRTRVMAQRTALVALGGFMVLNHLVPIF